MDLKKFEQENKKLYSQHRQDNFVLFYFNNKRGGTFVEFGANDGRCNSNTFYLEKELGWKGICIEPIPYVFEKLNQNRDCIKLNRGISDKEGIETFTVLGTYNYQLSGIKTGYSEKTYNRIIKQANDLNQTIEEMEIPCVTLCSILEENNMFHVDYMSIDIEGNELKVLQSIDFDKFYIDLLMVENNNRDKEQMDFVISKGYNYIGRLGADDVFSKSRKI